MGMNASDYLVVVRGAVLKCYLIEHFLDFW